MESPQNFLKVKEPYDIEEQIHAVKQLNLKLLQEIKIVLKKEKFLRNNIKSYVDMRESLAEEILNLNRQLSLEYLNIKNRQMEHDLIVKRYKNWEAVFCKIIEMKIESDKLKIKSIKNEINRLITQSGIQLIEILKQSDKEDLKHNNSLKIAEENGSILSEEIRWEINRTNKVEAEDKVEEQLKAVLFEDEIDYDDKKKSLGYHFSGMNKAILPKRHDLGIDIPILKIPIKFGESGNEKFCRDILNLKKPVTIHIPPGVKLFESSPLMLNLERVNEPAPKRKLCCVNSNDKKSENIKKKGHFSYGSVSKFEPKHLKTNGIKPNDAVFIAENITSQNCDSGLIVDITVSEGSQYSKISLPSLTNPFSQILEQNHQNLHYDSKNETLLGALTESHIVKNRLSESKHGNEKYLASKSDSKEIGMSYLNKTMGLNKNHLKLIKLRRNSYEDAVTNVTVDQESQCSVSSSSQLTKPCTRLLSLNRQNFEYDNKKDRSLSSSIENYTVRSHFDKDKHSLCQKSFTNQKYCFDHADDFVNINEYLNEIKKMYFHTSFDNRETSTQNSKLIGCETTPVLSPQKSRYRNCYRYSKIVKNVSSANLKTSNSHCGKTGSETCVNEVLTDLKHTNGSSVNGNDKTDVLNNSFDNDRSHSTENCVVEVSIGKENFVGSKKAAERVIAGFRKGSFGSDFQLNDNAYCFCVSCFNGFIPDICTKTYSPEKDFSMSSIEGNWRKKDNQEFNIEFSCVKYEN